MMCEIAGITRCAGWLVLKGTDWAGIYERSFAISEQYFFSFSFF